MWAERMLTVQARYLLNFVPQAFQVFEYYKISEARAHTCNFMFVLKYDARYTSWAGDTTAISLIPTFHLAWVPQSSARVTSTLIAEPYLQPQQQI